MNKGNAVALIGAMMAMSEEGFDVSIADQDLSMRKESKECKYSKCDAMHNHNNACCSAEHYKLWRAEQTKGGGDE